MAMPATRARLAAARRAARAAFAEPALAPPPPAAPPSTTATEDRTLVGPLIGLGLGLGFVVVLDLVLYRAQKAGAAATISQWIWHLQLACPATFLAWALLMGVGEGHFFLTHGAGQAIPLWRARLPFTLAACLVFGLGIELAYRRLYQSP